jgi:putative DNA primase/helicase
METLGSPVKAFIRDRCLIGPEHQIPIDELYEAYKLWCQDQDNRHPSNKEWFGRNLNSAVPGVKTTRPEVEGERTRTYVGIGLRPQPPRQFQVLSQVLR